MSLSPNFGPRRDGLTPSLILIHYTAMRSAQAAIDRLCDPSAQVSAHYVICRTGAVTQLVAEEMRAWHAGVGGWHGVSDINSRSIGIELDNDGTAPFTEPQMTALEDLMTGIMQRWAIQPDGVIGHSDIAPGRKIDPGPHFDWLRLEHQGLVGRRAQGSVAFDPDPAEFRKRTRARGYTADVDDQTLLNAVRLRYRPWAQGPLTKDDFAVL